MYKIANMLLEFVCDLTRTTDSIPSAANLILKAPGCLQ
jgi:hypothetical protein